MGGGEDPDNDDDNNNNKDTEEEEEEEELALTRSELSRGPSDTHPTAPRRARPDCFRDVAKRAMGFWT